LHGRRRTEKEQKKGKEQGEETGKTNRISIFSSHNFSSIFVGGLLFMICDELGIGEG